MTSIEYFAEQIGVLYTQFSNGFISLNDFQLAFNNEYQQAKEMHKQEMVNFGNDLIAQNDINYIGIPNLAEQYYYNTFKKDKL